MALVPLNLEVKVPRAFRGRPLAVEVFPGPLLGKDDGRERRVQHLALGGSLRTEGVEVQISPYVYVHLYALDEPADQKGVRGTVRIATACVDMHRLSVDAHHQQVCPFLHVVLERLSGFELRVSLPKGESMPVVAEDFALSEAARPVARYAGRQQARLARLRDGRAATPSWDQPTEEDACGRHVPIDLLVHRVFVGRPTDGPALEWLARLAVLHVASFRPRVNENKPENWTPRDLAAVLAAFFTLQMNLRNYKLDSFEGTDSDQWVTPDADFDALYDCEDGSLFATRLAGALYHHKCDRGTSDTLRRLCHAMREEYVMLFVVGTIRPPGSGDSGCYHAVPLLLDADVYQRARGEAGGIQHSLEEATHGTVSHNGRALPTVVCETTSMITGVMADDGEEDETGGRGEWDGRAGKRVVRRRYPYSGLRGLHEYRVAEMAVPVGGPAGVERGAFAFAKTHGPRRHDTIGTPFESLLKIGTKEGTRAAHGVYFTWLGDDTGLMPDEVRRAAAVYYENMAPVPDLPPAPKAEADRQMPTAFGLGIGADAFYVREDDWDDRVAAEMKAMAGSAERLCVSEGFWVRCVTTPADRRRPKCVGARALGGLGDRELEKQLRESVKAHAPKRFRVVLDLNDLAGRYQHSTRLLMALVLQPERPGEELVAHLLQLYAPGLADRLPAEAMQPLVAFCQELWEDARVARASPVKPGAKWADYCLGASRSRWEALIGPAPEEDGDGGADGEVKVVAPYAVQFGTALRRSDHSRYARLLTRPMGIGRLRRTERAGESNASESEAVELYHDSLLHFNGAQPELLSLRTYAGRCEGVRAFLAHVRAEDSSVLLRRPVLPVMVDAYLCNSDAGIDRAYGKLCVLARQAGAQASRAACEQIDRALAGCYKEGEALNAFRRDYFCHNVRDWLDGPFLEALHDLCHRLHARRLFSPDFHPGALELVLEVHRGPRDRLAMPGIKRLSLGSARAVLLLDRSEEPHEAYLDCMKELATAAVREFYESLCVEYGVSRRVEGHVYVQVAPNTAA